MGLDMYLLEDVYIGGRVLKDAIKDKLEIPLTSGNIKISLSELDSITLLKGQWKGFEAVHSWIVRECDNSFIRHGYSFYIPNDKLKELLEICKEIFYDKTKSVSLLPSEGGPDLESEESPDRYYMDDIEYTITVLESLDLENGLYRYEADF